MVRNSAFLLRNSEPIAWRELPMEAIFTPTISSPATPNPISNTLATSTRHLTIDGLAGNRVTPRKSQIAHASISSRQSCRIIHSSMNTPITTKEENTHTQGSQCLEEMSKALMSLLRADTELSNADMALSRAEGSFGRREARLAKITIALFLVPIGYAAWIVIVTEREDRADVFYDADGAFRHDHGLAQVRFGYLPL